MTFPRIRAPGMWVLGSVISPAEMELFDQDQFQAVDGFGGGAYAPTARLVFGGAGIDMTGGTAGDPLGPLTSTAALGSGASGVYSIGDGIGAGVWAIGGAAGPGVVGISSGPGLPGTAGVFQASGGTLLAPAAGIIAEASGLAGHGGVFFAAGPSSGVQATGGGTDGYGGSFLGGGANGSGVNAQGQGSGAAVVGFGGTSGNALVGHGGNASSGCYGIGGTTSGVGVTGVGGTPNGDGVFGIGTGTTGNGVNGLGATLGAGIVGSTGGSGPGVLGFGAGTADAVFASDGPVHCDHPGGFAPGKDRLYSTNIPKGLITVFCPGNGTGVVEPNAFGMTLIGVGGNGIVVGLTHAMVDTNYQIACTISTPSPVVFPTPFFPSDAGNITTTQIGVDAWDLQGGGPVSLNAGVAFKFRIAVFGEQA